VAAEAALQICIDLYHFFSEKVQWKHVVVKLLQIRISILITYRNTNINISRVLKVHIFLVI
jgi:hypothetical protein